MREQRIESAEHVLPGHPDKLCDAAVDAIVDFVRRGEPGVCPGDPDGQCGLEAAVIFGGFSLTGRIAAREDLLAALEIPEIVEAVYCCAGYGTDAAGFEWKPAPQGLAVFTQLCIGPFADGRAGGPAPVGRPGDLRGLRQRPR